MGMTIQRMIELLAFERKCVESANECDRNCAECNLVQDTDELLEMYDSVIAVLKAQEPVEPVQDMVGDALFWVCGKCGYGIMSTDWYCSNCGRAVKWE